MKPVLKSRFKPLAAHLHGAFHPLNQSAFHDIFPSSLDSFPNPIRQYTIDQFAGLRDLRHHRLVGDVGGHITLPWSCLLFAARKLGRAAFPVVFDAQGELKLAGREEAIALKSGSPTSASAAASSCKDARCCARTSLAGDEQRFELLLCDLGHRLARLVVAVFAAAREELTL